MTGGTSVATAWVFAMAEGFPAASFLSLFVATTFLATALRFFFAVFLLADFDFRVRIACFCIELRFVGTGIPFAT